MASPSQSFFAASPVRSTFPTVTSAGEVAANALVELEKGLMVEKTRNAELNAEVGRLSGVQRLLAASEDNEKQLRTKVSFLEEDKRQTTAYLEGLVNTTKDQLMASQADNARLNESLQLVSRDFEAHKQAAATRQAAQLAENSRLDQELRATKDTLLVTTHKFEEEIRQKDATIEVFRRDNADQKVQIAQQANTIVDLRKEVADLRVVQASLENEVRSLRAQIESKEADNRVLLQSNIKLEEADRQNKGNIAALQGSQAELTGKLNVSRSETETMRSINAGLANERDLLSATKAKLEEDVLLRESRNRSLESDLARTSEALNVTKTAGDLENRRHAEHSAANASQINALTHQLSETKIHADKLSLASAELERRRFAEMARSNSLEHELRSKEADLQLAHRALSLSPTRY